MLFGCVLTDIRIIRMNRRMFLAKNLQDAAGIRVYTYVRIKIK
jgi:hypothetical protein